MNLEEELPDYFKPTAETKASEENEQFPDYFNAASTEYNDKNYSFSRKAHEFVSGLGDYLPSARNVMQSAIGAAEGLVYSNPSTAAAAMAANFLFPAQVEEEIKTTMESDREYQEAFKNAPDKLPPLDETQLREGVAKAQKKLLSDESLITGILSSPFRLAGVDTKPQNSSERLNRNAFSMISAVSTGGYNSLLPPSSVNYLATNMGKTAVAAYTAAGLAEVGRELYGLPGEIMGEMLFVGGYKGFEKGAQWLKNLKERIPTNPKQFAVARISPEHAEDVTPFLRMAEEKGIPISPGTMSDNPFVKSVEKFIFENNLTHKEAQEFRELAANEFAKQYDNYLSRTQGAYAFAEPGAVAQELRRTVINPREQQLRESAVANYTNSQRGFEGAHPIPQQAARNIALHLNAIANMVSHSLIQSSAESGTTEITRQAARNINRSATESGHPELEPIQFTIGRREARNMRLATRLISSSARLRNREEAQRRYDRAQEILTAGRQLTVEDRARAQRYLGNLRELMGAEGDFLDIDQAGNIIFTREIYPQNLVATARSISEIAEWDKHSVVNLLKPFRHEIQNVLEDNYSMTHPVAYEQYRTGNRQFGEAAQLFWQKGAPFKKWNINSTTTPEQLANSLNSVRSFHELENEFGRTPQGQQLIDYMKRFKLDRILKPVFNQMREGYVPGKFAAKFEGLENNHFIKYLMGPKAYRQFKDLAQLDRFLKKNAGKIYNDAIPSGTSNSFFGILKAAAFVWNYPGALPTAVASLAAHGQATKYLKEVASLYKNPEIAKQFVTVARKAMKKNADPKKIAAEMELTMQSLRLQAAQDEAIDIITPNS